MKTEKAVAITAKLYECRDQQVFLGGKEKFIAVVHEYRPLFEAVMDEVKCSEISALTELLGRVKKRNISNPGMLMHTLCAVACELAEPKYINR